MFSIARSAARARANACATAALLAAATLFGPGALEQQPYPSRPIHLMTLTDAVQTALAAPQTVEALQRAGLDARFTSPAEFQQVVAAEMELWPSVVRMAGIPTK